jgi:hypothetical protein
MLRQYGTGQYRLAGVAAFDPVSEVVPVDRLPLCLGSGRWLNSEPAEFRATKFVTDDTKVPV